MIRTCMVWELMVFVIMFKKKKRIMYYYLMACVILLQTSSLRNRGYYMVWHESLI